MNENEQTGDTPENTSADATAAVEIPGGNEVDPSAAPEDGAGVVDDANDETGLTAAHGILSEIDQRVHCLKEGVIRLDERQVHWISGKLAELRAAL